MLSSVLPIAGNGEGRNRASRSIAGPRPGTISGISGFWMRIGSHTIRSQCQVHRTHQKRPCTHLDTTLAVAQGGEAPSRMIAGLGMRHAFGKCLRTGTYELGLLPKDEVGSIAQVKGTNTWGMGNRRGWNCASCRAGSTLGCLAEQQYCKG